jgi:flagellar basal body-associated protein FliL
MNNTMNGVALQSEPMHRRRVRLWLWIALVVAIVLAANAHLVYVAVSSQPACVTHVRQGEGSADRGRLSAAESSCSPRTQGDAS